MERKGARRGKLTHEEHLSRRTAQDSPGAGCMSLKGRLVVRLPTRAPHSRSTCTLYEIAIPRWSDGSLCKVVEAKLASSSWE